MAPRCRLDIPLFAAVGLAACLAVGCAETREPNRLVECQNENLRLRKENDNLTRGLVQANRTIESQQRQIATLQKMGPERLKELTHVASVQLGRLTSGYSSKHTPYEDGVAVYIEPYDSEGHLVKVAGSLRVRLFELQVEPPRLIGELTLLAKELEKHWIGRFWTNHYSVHVPFQKTPASRHITVQAEFTELLTGKTFVAEKLVEINLPTTTTASAPAR
jgi:hypothetical protein